MIQIEIPEKVNRIISTLAAAGYEAYAVGGCVRDALLGREPADWDITTSASPCLLYTSVRHLADGAAASNRRHIPG